MKQVIDTKYVLKINNKLFYKKGTGGTDCMTLNANQAKGYPRKDTAIEVAKELGATVYKIETVIDVLEEA